MDWLIWTGAAVSMGGVAALLWCVVYALRARRAGLDDVALRARLKTAVLVNLVALMVSALGLMIVVAGIVLG